MHSRLRDLLKVAALTTAVWLSSAVFVNRALGWRGTLIAIGAGASLLLLRRRPLAALALTVGLTLLQAYRTGAVFPMGVFTLVALYGVGLACSMSVVVVAAALSMTLVFAMAEIVDRIPEYDLGNGLQLGWFAAAVAMGLVTAGQRRFRQEAEERVRRAEETRETEARRRVSEERLRIAQELHDVIGHSIAMIRVQAGVAEHVLDTQPEEARASVQMINEASGTALEEIRMTLGLLRREDDGAPPVTPPPGLDQVPALVENAHKAGLTVEYLVLGIAHDVPAVVEATVHRIVQESLTNVLHHAGPGTQVRILLDYRQGVVRVEVTDRGGPGGVGGGSGLGLRGMRERIQAVGGTLEAGPIAPRGFRVAAQIPTSSFVS
ncbi:histidine kinase [Streptomyces sp. NPDC005728]|uniref:sensor histidine kinase n=1 Tax=Streptomyces sp. NPDC005728 TaxID=3157054 RepID=UPI0033EC1472